jgi:uridylate kinase
MKKVVLKISGEVFTSSDMEKNKLLLGSLVNQIKKLRGEISFHFVVGGGNFFRGNQHGKALSLCDSVGHSIGMLATIMNGLILYDLLLSADVSVKMLGSVNIPGYVEIAAEPLIRKAISKNESVIFVGGTGFPFFSTDTNAVIRALQVGAGEVWKGTKEDFVYSSDPAKGVSCKPLKNLTYDNALQQSLAFMDKAALSIAQEHDLLLRFFNIFSDKSLCNVYADKNFGSTISNNVIN